VVLFHFAHDLRLPTPLVLEYFYCLVALCVDNQSGILYPACLGVEVHYVTLYDSCAVRVWLCVFKPDRAYRGLV
jgi:hypothetical protein